MTSKQLKSRVVLSITSSYRGVGFAVLDGETLVDWGVRVIRGENHAKRLLKAEQLMALYQPDVLALENYKQSRRSEGVRSLMREMATVAAGRNIEVKVFTRGQICAVLCGDGRTTKDALAEALIKRFPEELGFRVPPKRRDWMSENYRMIIFDAVAFGVMAAM